MADGMPDLHVRHVTDVDRCSRDFFDDDVLDVLRRPDQPHAADHGALTVPFQNVAALVGVVPGDGVEHLMKR